MAEQAAKVYPDVLALPPAVARFIAGKSQAVAAAQAALNEAVNLAAEMVADADGVPPAALQSLYVLRDPAIGWVRRGSASDPDAAAQMAAQVAQAALEATQGGKDESHSPAA
jgi:hypothetical protein